MDWFSLSNEEQRLADQEESAKEAAIITEEWDHRDVKGSRKRIPPSSMSVGILIPKHTLFFAMSNTTTGKPTCNNFVMQCYL